MSKSNPNQILEEIKQIKTTANRSKSAVVNYERTSKRKYDSIENLFLTSKKKINEYILDFTKQLKRESEKTKQSTQQEASTVEEIRKIAKSDYEKFKRTHNAASSKKNGVEVKHQKVLRLSDEASEKVNEINKNATKALNNSDKINELLISSRKMDKEISAIYGEADAINTEIQNTYAITLDTTMAGTFKERRDSLKTRTENWEKAYLGSIAVIILGAILVLIFGRNDSFIDLVTERLVLVTPFILISVVLSRQFGHERKLYEEYSFKTAAAQSLRGYTLLLNNEFKDLELAREKILDFTIDAMKGIYDREALLQNPSVVHLMFGNDFAKFEARIEETVVRAVKKEMEEIKEEPTPSVVVANQNN